MFELELKGLGPVDNMTLVSEPSTALAAPDLAHVTLFKEDVDAITTNTDLLAWASRSKQTFTATNASNVLNATAHGLSNTDRVILASTFVDAVPSANQCSAMTSATAPSGTVSSDQTGQFNYHNWHAFRQPAIRQNIILIREIQEMHIYNTHLIMV